MEFLNYFLSLLIVVSLFSPVLTERCISNYTVFLNGGAIATKTDSCPIKKPYFSNTPPRKGVLLEDGACIGRGYKKTIVKSTSGFFESGKLSIHGAQKHGWDCYPKENGWNRTECKLRQTLVYTNIQDYVVRDIDDLRRTVTLDLSLSLMWMDYGIKTWTPKNEEQTRIGAIGLPHERINDIWNPHIHIYDLADYSAYKRSLNIVSLNVLMSNYLDPRNGLCLYGPMVQYEMDAKITFYCDFDYSFYPKDESICKFRFGGQRANLRFTLDDNDNVTSEGDRNNHIGYFDIAGKVVEEPMNINGKMMHVLGLDIKIKRGIRPFILQYYVPCATITVVSQFSFFIPFTAIPGRVALLVTQFLTLTSLFIHQMVCKVKIYQALSLTTFDIFKAKVEFNHDDNVLCFRDNHQPDLRWIIWLCTYWSLYSLSSE